MDACPANIVSDGCSFSKRKILQEPTFFFLPHGRPGCDSLARSLPFPPVDPGHDILELSLLHDRKQTLSSRPPEHVTSFVHTCNALALDFKASSASSSDSGSSTPMAALTSASSESVRARFTRPPELPATVISRRNSGACAPGRRDGLA